MSAASSRYRAYLFRTCRGRRTDLPPHASHIYKHITLPTAGRGKQAKALDPEQLPARLIGALTILYKDYEKVFANWQGKGSPTPPVFIVVCNNTATSKLVHDGIAGYEITEKSADGSERTVLMPGKLALFVNVQDDGSGQRRMSTRPVTILIDSEELESGDALSNTFRRPRHLKSTHSNGTFAPGANTRRRRNFQMQTCCGRSWTRSDRPGAWANPSAASCRYRY